MLTMVSDVNLIVPGEGTKLGSSGVTKEGEGGGEEVGKGGEGGEGEEGGEGGEGGGVANGIGDVTLGEGRSVLTLSLVRDGREGEGV